MSGASAGPVSPWADAAAAAALLAVDPTGVTGISIRAHAGPVRDAWLELFRALLPADRPVRRVPVHVKDDRLLGGLDLAATLQAGRPVAERGLLAESDGGVLLIPMAERLPPATAARLGAVMDRGEVMLERDGLAVRAPARFAVVALDEGISEEERPPAALLDRLAFQIDLTDLRLQDTIDMAVWDVDVADARARLGSIQADDAVLEALTGAAMAFGIASIRAPLLALKAARAAAALAGRDAISNEDAALGARLVYAARATVLPEPEDAPDEEPQDEDEPPPEEPEEQQMQDGPLEDMVLESVQAAIPAGLLAWLRAAERRRARAAAGRSAASRQAGQRGRPVGTRRGAPRGGARLNVVETLRAAAPWQPLRRRDRDAPGPGEASAPRVEVRQDDFRITRLKQRAETTTIFVVDASGSAALHRLGEAKGAVELLLADCYVRRDQVALLAFRGQGAEILLPPTRSLVRAKRSLAALPGGGGTPLAAALEASVALADAVRRKGSTPTVVLLTDGRANVARDGTPGRAQASEDALAAARAVRASGVTALLIDTSPQPQARAAEVAGEMDAIYLPLPHADAAALSQAVRASTEPLAVAS